MRIVILTEGTGEYKSLPRLFPQLNAKLRAHSKIVRILKINVSPEAPNGQIAAACVGPIRIAATMADMVVVLLDRENRSTCPGELASELEQALATKINSDIKLKVVFKDRTFENWLVAAMGSLEHQSARYKIDASTKRKITPDKADRTEALAILKKCVRKNPSYDKIRDGDKICEHASISEMARNSRSFRHFLHIIHHDDYRTQCRRALN